MQTLVNLQRLLHKCEQMAASAAATPSPTHLDQSSPAVGDDFSHQFRFRMFVGTLRQMIDQLQRENVGGKYTALIHEYLRRVQRLHDLVDEEKLLSPADRGLSYSKYCSRVGGQSLAELNRERQEEIRATNRVRDSLRRELLSESIQPPANEHDETLPVPHQQAMHDEYAMEMAKMAQQLKLNSLAFHDVLRQDQQIMDKTLKVMDNSQSRLRKELGRLKVFTDKYSNTCLMQILLMLVVVMVFVIMYIFIRLVPKKTASVAVLSNLSPATLTSNGPVSTAISVINHNEL